MAYRCAICGRDLSECGHDLPPADDYPTNIGDTCCGKCPGATCYVDYLTGERS
jgi:hypothetical protein